MLYQEAVESLYALSGELVITAGAPRQKFELDHMRTLVAALDQPQRRFPSVLIAGTNGKGSTAATLASILSVAGYKTGLYTSPHLLRPNERIQVSGNTPGTNSLAKLCDEAFADVFQRVSAAAQQLVQAGRLPHLPSYFEVITAMAFVAFAEAGIEFAVLEVGLGGRLDATNVVEPVVSVITDIALDHTEWLGDTITLIAREKAGILRPNGTLVTLPQHPEANTAIGEIAMALGVTGINAAAYLPDRLDTDGPYTLPVGGQAIRVASPLPGNHQRRNTALAVATALQLAQSSGFSSLTPNAIEAGIAATKWPGRLERRDGPNGLLLLDVAHNPAGAWTLRSYLSKAMDSCSIPAPRTLVFSALKDKSILEMAQILFPLFDGDHDRILLAPVNSPRAATAETLSQAAATLDTPSTTCASVTEAMRLATSTAGSVIVSGSVYLVAEAKAWLQETHI